MPNEESMSVTDEPVAGVQKPEIGLSEFLRYVGPGVFLLGVIAIVAPTSFLQKLKDYPAPAMALALALGPVIHLVMRCFTEYIFTPVYEHWHWGWDRYLRRKSPRNDSHDAGDSTPKSPKNDSHDAADSTPKKLLETTCKSAYLRELRVMSRERGDAYRVIRDCLFKPRLRERFHEQHSNLHLVYSLGTLLMGAAAWVALEVWPWGWVPLVWIVPLGAYVYLAQRCEAGWGWLLGEAVVAVAVCLCAIVLIGGVASVALVKAGWLLLAGIMLIVVAIRQDIHLCRWELRHLRTLGTGAITSTLESAGFRLCDAKDLKGVMAPRSEVVTTLERVTPESSGSPAHASAQAEEKPRRGGRRRS